MYNDKGEGKGCGYARAGDCFFGDLVTVTSTFARSFVFIHLPGSQLIEFLVEFKAK